MTLWLKKDTAATIPLGPFIDDTDGKTAEEGLTTDYTLIYLSKNGGDLTAKADTTDLVHAGIGHYHCVLGTGDTDTLGTLRVAVHVAGSLPVWQDCMVVNALVWDSLFGTDKLQVHVAEMTNDIITAASINTGALTADAFAADAIIAATLATGAITADAFAADALVAATFATDCITDDAIATGAIASTAFAAGAINAAAIADGAIDAATFAAGAINAAAIADAAIDNATFAADVGSTALATNMIAKAAEKAVGVAGLSLTAIPTVATVTSVTGIAAGGITNASFAADVGSTALATNMIGKAAEKAVGVGGLSLNAIPTIANVTTVATTTAVTNDVGITQAGADKVWTTAARTITALDEDSTTIDLNGTTIGTVTNVTNGVTLAADAITAAGIADNAFSAEHFAAACLDNATFAADVGTTALASNPLAQAAAKGAHDSLVASHVIAATFGKYLGGAPAGATLAADVAALKGVADTIAGDTTTDIPNLIDALPTAIENADALLNRDMSAVSDTNARSPLNALRILRNKVTTGAGILTVTKENDTTTAWAAAVTSDIAANPITSIDPST